MHHQCTSLTTRSMINWCTDAWMHWYSDALMTPGYNDHMNNDAMMTGCIDGLMHWFTDGLMYRYIGALKNRCIYVLENCCTDALDKLIYTLMHQFLIYRHIDVLIPATGCIDALKNWWLKVLYNYIDAQIHWCINWLIGWECACWHLSTALRFSCLLVLKPLANRFSPFQLN